MFRRKNRLYKRYISGGMGIEDRVPYDETSLIFNDLISDSTSNYFKNLGEKLNDHTTSSKAYWSILHRFLGKVKIPSIPPLLITVFSSLRRLMFLITFFPIDVLITQPTVYYQT